jgi:hypothetical protein
MRFAPIENSRRTFAIIAALVSGAITLGVVFGAASAAQRDYMAETCRSDPKATTIMCAGYFGMPIVKKCGGSLGIDATLAQHLEVAECVEKAASTHPIKGVSDWLLQVGQDHRRRSKPGVAIGMTSDQVINDTDWGAPRSRNTTMNASGIHEQWVYGFGYLYFDNGVLTSIQKENVR